MRKGLLVLCVPSQVALCKAHVIINVDVVIQEGSLERFQGQSCDWQGEWPMAGLVDGADTLSGAFGAVAPEADLGDFDGLTVIVRAEFWIEGATFVIPEPSGRLLHLSALVVLGIVARRQRRITLKSSSDIDCSKSTVYQAVVLRVFSGN